MFCRFRPAYSALSPIVFAITALALFLTTPASAQISSIVEVERLGTSELENPTQARKEIIDNIVEQAALDSILEMIGEKKYQKYKSLIHSKIINDTGKFVSTIKTSRLSKLEVEEQTQYQMMVALKLSQQNLKSLLLEHGLLYNRDGQPVIMPFIEILDNVHQLKYRWWSSEVVNDTDLAHKMSRLAEKSLHYSLAEKGFYSSQPSGNHFRSMLPEPLRSEPPVNEAFNFFSTFYNFDIYITGQVTVDTNPEKPNTYVISLKWVAKYQNTHRVIAEVNRHFTSEYGDFESVVNKALNLNLASASKDLTRQLLNSWQKGTFGASLLTLTLNGPLEYKELLGIKTQLLKNAKIVKRIRERRFAPGQVTLEADVTGDPSELNKLFTSTELEGLTLRITEIGASKVVLQVQRDTFTNQ